MSQFVLVSGLPGSGKSTLARRLAPALDLPLFDKDSFLEALFESRGAGDAAWRRALSREADEILQAQATAAGHGVLVSHWRVEGMPANSGTPIDWISELTVPIVHVRCICEPKVAAKRFFHRQRHPGHLDRTRSFEDVLASIQENARQGTIDIGHPIDIDTTREPALEDVLREIRAAYRA